MANLYDRVSEDISAKDEDSQLAMFRAKAEMFSDSEVDGYVNLVKTLMSSGGLTFEDATGWLCLNEARTEELRKKVLG